MRRVPLVLLGVAGLVLWAGPAALYASWALALVALALATRDATLRKPAIAGLVLVVVLVVAALVGSGVTIGRNGTRLAQSPILDPTELLLAAGVLASWLSLAVLLVALEWPRGKRLAAWALGLGLVGSVLFALDLLTRRGYAPGAGIVVGGSALAWTLGGALVLLAASWARQCLSRAPA